MRKSYWRQIAAPIIEKVLKETKGKSEKEIRKALREAYPFGARDWHPYQMWLKEIRVQRGIRSKKKKVVNEKQLKLFE